MPRAIRYRSAREQETSTSEDSDIIVALFRTCAIIAFYTIPLARGEPVSILTQAVALVASLFTLGLFISMLVVTRWGSQRLRTKWRSRPVLRPLLRRRLVLQRVGALTIDLALLYCVAGELQPTDSARILPVFYLITAVGALWFHRVGGLLTALVGTAAWYCVVGSAPMHEGAEFDQVDAQWVMITHGPVLLLQGFVIGCLARARDAEHRSASQMHQELAVARVLQQAMLPARLPSIEGYDIGVLLSTAEAVGGDYHDVLQLDEGRLALCVADISGKSVYGFVYLSLLRSRLHIAAAGLPPGEVARQVNAAMCGTMHPESFVSMFFAVLDPPSGVIRYVNCGHQPPLLLRPHSGSEAEELRTGDIVLGVLEKASYTEATVTIEPGALLVCCTDGVPEARNAKWEEFGTERLIAAVQSTPEASAQAIASQVLAAADEFGADPKWDDATVLVLKREPC